MSNNPFDAWLFHYRCLVKLLGEALLGAENVKPDISLCDLVEPARRLREAVFPRPEVKDTAPLILYFSTKKEREEFIDAVREAKPHMKSYRV